MYSIGCKLWRRGNRVVSRLQTWGNCCKEDTERTPNKASPRGLRARPASSDLQPMPGSLSTPKDKVMIDEARTNAVIDGQKATTTRTLIRDLGPQQTIENLEAGLTYAFNSTHILYFLHYFPMSDSMVFYIIYSICPLFFRFFALQDSITRYSAPCRCSS